MSKSTLSQKSSEHRSSPGCLILFFLPILYFFVVFPFQEFANGCPNGGPKGVTPRSIARPALDCSTFGRTHTVALITGVAAGSYLRYRRNRQQQPLITNEENVSKTAPPGGWAKIMFAGLVTLLCNLIAGLGFSTSRAVGTFIITAPLSFGGGLLVVFFITLIMELFGWINVNSNE